jgi:hypothetical protein
MNVHEPAGLVTANKLFDVLTWHRNLILQFISVAAPIPAMRNLTKSNRKKLTWGNLQHGAFIDLKQ